MKTAIITVVMSLAFTGMARATLVNSNSIVEYEIEYYMQTDNSVYDLGENVQMLFRVTNLRDEDVGIGCSRSLEFNFWVQEDGETIWMKEDGWFWHSDGITLLAGESTDLPFYNWDMIDDTGNFVQPGIYNVVGVMYNEPWNYDHGGSYSPTEVSVSITIVPEPGSLSLLLAGMVYLTRKRMA